MAIRSLAPGIVWWAKLDEQNLTASQEQVQRLRQQLRDFGLSRLRVGVSWAEWDTSIGRSWIIWYMKELSRDFELLPCLAFTPPERGVVPMTNAPPREPVRYAEFVADFLKQLNGYCGSAIEHWNEYDIVTDWNEAFDPNYQAFIEMIAMGALVARAYGKRSVLGGMSNVAKGLPKFRLLVRSGLIRHYLDVVGFHNLRGTWSDKTPPLLLPDQTRAVAAIASEEPDHDRVTALRVAIRTHAAQASWTVRQILERPVPTGRRAKEIWLTEYGFPPYDPSGSFEPDDLEEIQVACFAYAIILIRSGCLKRIYWYGLSDDKSISLREVTTGWNDELIHWYGLATADGKERLLGRLLHQGGVAAVLKYAAGQGCTNRKRC